MSRYVDHRMFPSLPAEIDQPTVTAHAWKIIRERELEKEREVEREREREEAAAKKKKRA